MWVLTDYIDVVALKDMQEHFSSAAGCPVTLCGTDGESLVGSSSIEADDQTLSFPVSLEGEVVASVQIHRNGDTELAEKYHNQLGLMISDMVVRLGEEKIEVRSRIEQLFALHRVTAGISQGESLQSILDMVAQTVVETMKQKASSIRLLSDNGKELAIRSVHSLSPQYLDTRPVLLSESVLDREVLSSDRPVYVEDMTTDPRVIYPEMAVKEGVVSALCAPMIFEGRAEGILRVFSGEPYRFDWFEWQLLRTIANAAAAAIAHTRTSEQARLSWEMKRQLVLAGEVQRRMIPPDPKNVDGFEIAGRYIPSQQLSGDFYDFFMLPDNRIGIVICDVVGKGVRASILMSSIRASLRAHAANMSDMYEVIRKVNHDLLVDTLTSDFATMFYCVLDTKSRTLTYCGAGHLPPLLVRGGNPEYLESAGGMIGVLEDMDFPVDTITMETGDVLLMYTDGLVESMNFEGEEYGRKRAEEAILFAVNNGYNLESIIRYSIWDMRRFAGLSQRADDLTMVGIRVG